MLHLALFLFCASAVVADSSGSYALFGVAVLCFLSIDTTHDLFLCVILFPSYHQIACSYKSLPTSVQKGSRILVADGSLVLTVKECKET